MASNPTQLTPPRVPLIDPRNGAIAREWYMFFLSLLNAVEDNAEAAETDVENNAMGASYDAMIAALAQQQASQPDPMAAIAALQDQVAVLTQALALEPPAQPFIIDFGSTGLTPAKPATGSVRVAGTLAVGSGGTGAASFTNNKHLKGAGTGAIAPGAITDDGTTVAVDTGVGFTISRTAVTSPVAGDGNVYSGTYTPTATNVTNITSSTVNANTLYMRVGNTVTVAGQIAITATAAAAVVMRISLPVASAFAATSQAAGVIAAATAGKTASGGILANLATNELEIRIPNVPDISAIAYSFTASYRVI